MTGSESKMIKAVIFDVGGVLIRTHDHSYRRQWEQQLGLDEGQSEAIVFSGEMGTKAQSGAITTEALWEWIGRRLALDDETLRAFRRDFWAGDALDEELVAYIRSLRPHYQTAIISNATDNLHHALSELFNIADAFDLIVGSAAEKVMKPEPEIFHRTLKRLGRAPGEAVFIDDHPENVAGARSVGMHAIHFREGMDLPAALARLGVEPTERSSN